jgi:hypothetical protein
MLYVEVSDDTDPAQDLVVTVQHSQNGTTTWSGDLLGNMVFNDGLWQWDVTPKVDTNVGNYDFCASVEDTGGSSSTDFVLPNAVEVLNNIPTTPEVRILPQHPFTFSKLTVEFLQPSSDIESSELTYHNQWYCNGELKGQWDWVHASTTEKGQNWSVEVRAFDGIDEGPPGLTWIVIQNAAPIIKTPLVDPEIDEDTPDSGWIILTSAFEDPDGDPLTYSFDPTPSYIGVEIDAATGVVTLSPVENWYGAETINFTATDGEYQVTQTVTVTFLPVNDIPRITSIDGAPVVSDSVEYSINQGDVLVISFTAMDVEGDDILYNINTTMVDLDETLGQIRFAPDGDMVGVLRFGLATSDVVDPSKKNTLIITINVVNVNDPMDDPEITAPSSGTIIFKGFPEYFTAECFDPDVQYGQVLEFSWSSNLTGLMGTGAMILVSFDEIGMHKILLTVSDSDFSKTTSIHVFVVEFDSDGDGIQDTIDDFPQDPAASVDTDGDGYPNEWNEGMTESDSLLGLTIDYYPDNPDRWKKEEKKDEQPSLGVVGSIAAISIIATMMRRRGPR